MSERTSWAHGEKGLHWRQEDQLLSWRGLHGTIPASKVPSSIPFVTPARGAIIVGDSTPAWGALALGSSGRIPRSNGSDLVYSTFTLADTYVRGDIVRASAANTLGPLTVGAAGKIVRSDGTDPLYSTFTIPDTFTQGAVPYASAANVLAALAVGTAGQLLDSNGTIPVWVTMSGDATFASGGALTLANSGVVAGAYGGAATVGTFTVDAKGRLTAAAGVAIAIDAGAIVSGQVALARGGTGIDGSGITAGKIFRGSGAGTVALSTFTIPDTMAVSTLLYASAANVLAALPTANSGVLVTSAGGVPSIGTDIPAAVTIGGAYIYRVGGTDVAIADGGTNASSFAAVNGIVYYDGSALVNEAALTYDPAKNAISQTAGTLTDQYPAHKITAALPGGATTSYNAVMNIQATSTTNNNNAYPFNMDFLAGATDARVYAAGRFANAVAGTGTGAVVASGQGNYGIFCVASATTTGDCIGSVGVADSGNRNVGAQGFATVAKINALNVGVIGVGLNSGGGTAVQIGGFFGLMATAPTFASAAILCDNGSTTSDIFVARDNGTAVWSIVDGGVLTPGTNIDIGTSGARVRDLWIGRKIDISSGTLADQARALKIVATMPAVTTVYNAAMDMQITSATNNANAYAINIDFLAGATDARIYGGMRVANAVAGTGTNAFTGSTHNSAIFAVASATTTGDEVGVFGHADSGNRNYGVLGHATTDKANAVNIGVCGTAANAGAGGTQIGGYFGLETSVPTFASAALLCDNGSTTSDIFVARDAGSAVVTIADGGGVTMTGGLAGGGASVAAGQFRWQSATAVVGQFLLSDATTNAAAMILNVRHDTSGTAASGFGADIGFSYEDDGGANRTAGRLRHQWATATSASRASRLRFLLSAGGTDEGIGFEFFGTTTANVFNIGLCLQNAAGSYGGGEGVAFLRNAGTAPTSNPTNGCIIYATGGAGTCRGSGGTVTTFGPAGPHCGECGKDEWIVATRNSIWRSWLYVCGRCGHRYSGGPWSVLDALTDFQRSQVLRDDMTYDDIEQTLALSES